MRRLVDFLAPIGLLVMAAASMAARQGYAVKPNLSTYLFVGLALVVLHLALRGEEVYRAIGGRQLRYGGNEEVDADYRFRERGIALFHNAQVAQSALRIASQLGSEERLHPGGM